MASRAGRKPTGKRRAAAPRRPAGGARKRRAAREQRALNKLFLEQVESLWTRFGTECRQFADGFNAEWGSPTLQIETGADVTMARFAGGGEVLVQLVRENHHVFCVMTSGCSELGACRVDQLPLGLSIADGRLGFVYGENSMSEAGLAVKLLTDLMAMDTPGMSADRV